MSLLVKITLAAALILSIAVPFGAFAMGEKSKGRYKKALACNMVLFFGVMAVSAGLMFTGNAYAAEEAASAVSSSATGFGYLAAALSTGLSCVGGGIAVSAGRTAYRRSLRSIPPTSRVPPPATNTPISRSSTRSCLSYSDSNMTVTTMSTQYAVLTIKPYNQLSPLLFIYPIP